MVLFMNQMVSFIKGDILCFSGIVLKGMFLTFGVKQMTSSVVILYLDLLYITYMILLQLSNWLMQRDVIYRVWVYNVYELPHTPVKPTKEIFVTKFIPILLTGWALPLLYLVYKSCRQLYQRYRPR